MATETRRPPLPGTVRVLGSASLLNDVASEMTAPVLPILLTTVLGAGPAVVGLIEGVAEAAASLLKLVSGAVSDRYRTRKPIVVAGYAVSNGVRPLVAFVGSWLPVLGIRFLDRVGKGLRTAPRDALIAGSVEAADRGRAFGFHRAMDHAGAMLGPLAAFALLQNGSSLADVFLWSAVPGTAVVVLLVVGLRDARPAGIARAAWPTWGSLTPPVRRIAGASAGLAFATVPDAFIVLWAFAQGISVAWIPLLWAAAHAVRSPVVQAAGLLSDRLGRRHVVAAGWVARVAALVLLGTGPAGPWWTWGLFLAYAATTALTEGAERAWIGDLSDPTVRATAFGAYHMAVGLAALPGAVVFGLVWEGLGMPVAFGLAAFLTAVAAIALLILTRDPGSRP